MARFVGGSWSRTRGRNAKKIEETWLDLFEDRDPERGEEIEEMQEEVEETQKEVEEVEEEAPVEEDDFDSQLTENEDPDDLESAR